MLCYLINSEHDPIRKQAIKTIRTLTCRHIDIWVSVVKAGIDNPPISNTLLSFVADSYLMSYAPEVKEPIEAIALEIYKSSVHKHFFQLYEKIMSPKSSITKADILQFVCELRLVNAFVKRFPTSDLKTICILCSKMALKS